MIGGVAYADARLGRDRGREEGRGAGAEPGKAAEARRGRFEVGDAVAARRARARGRLRAGAARRRQAGRRADRAHRALRSQLGQELGIAIPPVHIRDNLQLKPGEYAVLLKGVEIARAETRVGYVLAINPGAADPAFPGVPCKEPAFGLEALWVPSPDRERADLGLHRGRRRDRRGHASDRADPPSRGRPARTPGRAGAARRAREDHPKPVEELVPQLLSVGGVQKVMQNLLREKRQRARPADHRRVARGPRGDHQGPDPAHRACARRCRGRSCKGYIGPDRVLHVMTLAPTLERARIGEAVHRTGGGRHARARAGLAQRLLAKLAEVAEPFARCRPSAGAAVLDRHPRSPASLPRALLASLVLLAPAEIHTTGCSRSASCALDGQPAPESGPAVFNVRRPRPPPRRQEQSDAHPAIHGIEHGGGMLHAA